MHLVRAMHLSARESPSEDAGSGKGPEDGVARVTWGKRVVIATAFVLFVVATSLYRLDPFAWRADIPAQKIESVKHQLMQKYEITDVRAATRHELWMEFFPETPREAWDRVLTTKPGEGDGEVPRGVWVTLAHDPADGNPYLYVLAGDPLGGNPVLHKPPHEVTFWDGPNHPPGTQEMNVPDPATLLRDAGSQA